MLIGVGEGGVGAGKGACGLAGGLGQGLRFVQGQTIGLRLGQSCLQVLSVPLWRLSQWVVLRRRATSTEGCSMGTKWWRTVKMQIRLLAETPET